MTNLLRVLPVLLLLSCACGSEVQAVRGDPARTAPQITPKTTVPRSPAAPPSSVAAATPAASAAEPTPPPYDLAADVARRTAEATDELGARTEVTRLEGVFVAAAPGGRGALAGAVDVTRRALGAYFNGRSRQRPTRAISVYLFPEAKSYHGYCKRRWEKQCSSPYGFYLGSERRIVMNVGPGIGTLTHELVHPLVEADFPDAPDWINEGIASLYEQFHLPKPGEIRGSKNWRHPRLMAAFGSKKERELARPAALFGMTDDVFRGDHEDLNYATARYLCQWLDGKNLLWPFYQRWRDGFADDPTGEKAFAEVVGKSPAEAEAEWSRWVRAL